MRGTLSKLFLTATLLISGGVASADEWRGSTTDTRPVPMDRDHRDHRDRDDRDDRSGFGRHDRDDAPPQARTEHDRPRRGFTWVSGQWVRNHRRWVWMPGHYERISRRPGR
jgi:hypothetical protein